MCDCIPLGASPVALALAVDGILTNQPPRAAAGPDRIVQCNGRGAARFSLAVLAHSPAALRRLQLTLREIYFAGVLSLVIILVSGLFVGMAGALWGYYLTFLRPTIFLSILIGAKIVLMTILGGRGTVAGPVVGAIVFIGANEFFVSRFGASELNIAATGLLLILALLFFPDGIVGTLKRKGYLPKALDWD